MKNADVLAHPLCLGLHSPLSRVRFILQLHRVTIPDAATHNLPEGSRLSMAAGDFFEVYDDSGAAGLLAWQMCNRLIERRMGRETLCVHVCVCAGVCVCFVDASIAVVFLMTSLTQWADKWDCVASCFTLDTAKNPLAFLEVNTF